MWYIGGWWLHGWECRSMLCCAHVASVRKPIAHHQGPRDSFLHEAARCARTSAMCRCTSEGSRLGERNAKIVGHMISRTRKCQKSNCPPGNRQRPYPPHPTGDNKHDVSGENNMDILSCRVCDNSLVESCVVKLFSPLAMVHHIIHQLILG